MMIPFDENWGSKISGVNDEEGVVVDESEVEENHDLVHKAQFNTINQGDLPLSPK